MAQMKKPAPKKPTISRAPSKTPKTPMPKTGAKPLTGPAAIKAIQDRTSATGVKKAEAGAKKAIDKKYPGLYKATKEVTGKVNKSMDNKPMSPAEKAKAAKILEKIKADSKKKAKLEVEKKKAPKTNWISKL